MGESENVSVVRRIVDAFNRLDIDDALADANPDIELREWPTAPDAQTYRGADGVRRAVSTWFESWEWMKIEILELQDLDDRVVVTLHQRAQGKGSKVEVELTSSNVYTFRDGKVVLIELFTEREPALAAAGLTPDYQEEKR